MNTVKLEKQIFIQAKNKVGQFLEVTSALAQANVNMKGICAWSVKDDAYFALLTNDNAKAIAALSKKGFQPKEQEVAALMLDDKVGAAEAIAKKIKDANIDLDYVYGTTCECNNASALLVLISKDNAKLISCLNC